MWIHLQEMDSAQQFYNPGGLRVGMWSPVQWLNLRLFGKPRNRVKCPAKGYIISHSMNPTNREILLSDTKADCVLEKNLPESHTASQTFTQILLKAKEI